MGDGTFADLPSGLEERRVRAGGCKEDPQESVARGQIQPALEPWHAPGSG